MKNLLSLISKVHEKGNRFIIIELKKHGAGDLAPSHGDILAVLYSNGKMTMKDIADRIHRTKPTVTVLIDKLERLGYVRRDFSAEDSRFTYILLTEKGEEFKEVFDKISLDLNKMLYKNLSDEESHTLEELLKKII